MFIIDVVLIVALLWNLIIKKEVYSPAVFWCVIWIISLTFALLNPFDMMEISHNTIIIIGVGTIMFLIGSMGKRTIHFVFKKSKKVFFEFDKKDQFNKSICYLLLLITIVFNLVVLVTVVNFLRSGTSYSSVRDILFGYGDNASSSFFSSTFFSTFFSWIIGPAMSILLIVALINFIVKQLSTVFNWLVLIDIAIYTFATSGRMLLLHAVVFLFFVYKYNELHIPKHLKRKVWLCIISAVVLLLVITFYRQKEADAVPTLYSYFCIDIPLLSYWTDYVDINNVATYGNAFFRGILEGINFFIGKLHLSTPGFWEMQEIFDLVQNTWIQIFPNNWYNAYVSCLFYFYLDFGIIGVAIGSFVFGKISKYVYQGLLKNRTLFMEIMYMLIIQLIIDSFVRWQIGTFSFLVTFFYAVICTKKRKRS
ncbi:O-antigen polymerase [Clostridium butyricum]|uniref:O-antigen polymerase n=1 Tax=Clostridium butyricum TaxID=1492 RepID=UPI002ABD2549|nr:O-antigen polymerase [Clostridium butyricum]